MGCFFSARVVGFCFGCLLVVVGLFRADAPISIIWLIPVVACARVVGHCFYFACPRLWDIFYLVACEVCAQYVGDWFCFSGCSISGCSPYSYVLGEALSVFHFFLIAFLA